MVDAGFTTSSSAGVGFVVVALSLAGVGIVAVVATVVVEAAFSASEGRTVVVEAATAPLADRALSAEFFLKKFVDNTNL